MLIDRAQVFSMPQYYLETGTFDSWPDYCQTIDIREPNCSKVTCTVNFCSRVVFIKQALAFNNIAEWHYSQTKFVMTSTFVDRFHIL